MVTTGHIRRKNRGVINKGIQDVVGNIGVQSSEGKKIGREPTRMEITVIKIFLDKRIHGQIFHGRTPGFVVKSQERDSQPAFLGLG
jgi:hypothetical protein